VIALALALAALPACRHPQAGGDADAAPAPDAPADALADAADAAAGIGCSARSPRAAAPETFVGPTGLQQRLAQLIDGAQASLDVGMYLFTVTALADRLIAARDRGVAVRVLLDPDHPGNVTVRDRLAAAGVPHRNAPTLYSYSHEKYLVIDGRAAVIMSMNFSADAMSYERNYGMIDRDPDDVADLQGVFDMDWAGGGGEAPKPADLACTRLIVSPTNAKVRILDLIARAQTTLEVEALYVSDPEVRDAIGAAKARGAAVRVILAPTTDNANEIAYFTGLGIPVRSPVGFFNHAKLIISDGVALVGSENFSLTSLTRNREVGALVFEPAPAQLIRQQFEADWAAGA
jgi:cardiolipin synthase